MGNSHSRTGELKESPSQLHRHCQWCQNSESFDDFYEPSATTTTSNKKKKANSQHSSACFKNTRRMKSKCRRMSKESLASVNLLKDSIISNFEQRQQNDKSVNCVMKTDNDASDNYLSYSHLSHDSPTQADEIPNKNQSLGKYLEGEIQVNHCSSLPSSSLASEPLPNIDNDIKIKSCRVLLTRRMNRHDQSLSSDDEENCKIMNPAQLNMMYESKCIIGTYSDPLFLDDTNYEKVMSLSFIFDGMHFKIVQWFKR
uniref:Uncharacterized protein n=1 Tax=Elaeophora elaphi TaxID=1147741 RepID=A0A0R3S3D6_9BILA